MLLEKRKEVEKQLQFRQRELRFLQQLQVQQRKRGGGKGEGGAKGSFDEQGCRSEAVAGSVEGGGEGAGVCERRSLKFLREELHRVTFELDRKSATVRQLEREMDRLEIYLDRANKKVEMLLVQSAASSKEALQKEIKVLVH